MRDRRAPLGLLLLELQEAGSGGGRERRKFSGSQHLVAFVTLLSVETQAHFLNKGEFRSREIGSSEVGGVLFDTGELLVAGLRRGRKETDNESGT